MTKGMIGRCSLGAVADRGRRGGRAVPPFIPAYSCHLHLRHGSTENRNMPRRCVPIEPHVHTQRLGRLSARRQVLDRSMLPGHRPQSFSITRLQKKFSSLRETAAFHLPDHPHGELSRSLFFTRSESRMADSGTGGRTMSSGPRHAASHGLLHREIRTAERRRPVGRSRVGERVPHRRITSARTVAEHGAIEMIARPSVNSLDANVEAPSRIAVRSRRWIDSLQAPRSSIDS